jgi:hypothetical protein
MFKVGDRVWAAAFKETGEIKNIRNKLYFIDFNKISGEFLESELHQTADDMFEALGFEKKLEDGSFIIFEYFNFENPFITELRIDKINKCHTLSYYTKNNKIFSGRIDVKLLQAIYQLYIEKGWLE